jgi:hypothetical protein
MNRGPKRAALFALLTAVLFAGVARGQDAAPPTDEQVLERLAFITKALDAAQPRAKAWWYGWIAGYGTATVVQGGLAAAHWNDVKTDASVEPPQTERDRGFAEDMLVGGATTALGVAGLLIDPFLPAYGPSRLRSLPETTDEDRRAKLAAAEDMLRRCARREAEGRGWRTHLLNIGVNALAGVATAAAFHRPWTDGLTTFAVGEAVSLLNIYTQPRRATRDLEAYEASLLGRRPGPARPVPGSAWAVGRIPGGISLTIRF